MDNSPYNPFIMPFENFSQHIKKANLLVVWFAIFMVGFFFTRNGYYHTHFFYFFVMFTSLFVIPVSFAESLGKSKLFMLAIAYTGYLLLTLFWSEGLNTYIVWQKILGGVGCLFFVMLTVYLFERHKQLLPHIILLMCWAAYLAAAVAVDESSSLSRFLGIGRGSNPIKTAELFGICVALFPIVWCNNTFSSTQRYIGAILVIGIVTAIILTVTRSVVVALYVNAILVCMLRKKVWMLLLVTAPVLIYITAAYMFDVHLIRQDIVLRYSGRFEMWQWMFDLASNAGALGIGIHPEQVFQPPGINDIIGYPHNILMAAYIYGGIPAITFLGLLLAMMVNVAWKEYTERNDINYLFLVNFVIIMGMFDFSVLFKPPHVEWLLFWFPLALCVMIERRQMGIEE